jgi:Arc/MetJ-type ribon-helix-helix transcriptional regulator
MTIHIPKNLEDSIREAVDAGRLASIDDAMAEAVSLLLEQQRPAGHRDAMTLGELHRQMLADGLLSQLPNDAADIDNDGEEPVVIEGEPLPGTIIRERRSRGRLFLRFERLRQVLVEDPNTHT